MAITSWQETLLTITTNKSKTSQYSYNYDVNIQPAFCGQTLGGHSFSISDSDCINSSSKINIYYQMGAAFSFVVPKSFTISSVIFDALDSSLLPTENWLNVNYQWCILNSNKTLSINNSNPNKPSSWAIKTLQTEECKTSFGSSFFKFSYSDTLSNIGGVGFLNLTNWVFQNFFYDFNSFIGLVNGHGKISVSGTTFNKFSNCGSIIRDTVEYPTGLNYISTGLQSSILNTYRDSMFTSNLYQNKYSIKPSTAWQNSTWASIKIDSSTFQNFNYMKTGGHTYHKVDAKSSMKYQGLILNLSNFYGIVTFSNNQVLNLKFVYNNWEEVYNNATTLDSADIWGTPTILQAKTLIYINVKNSPIEIFGNTFNNSNSLLGLIYLQKSSAYNSSILIDNNTFTFNSAIMGANILKLYMFTNVAYTASFNLNYMICAGVQISNNILKQNIGCFNTTGTIQAICYTDGVDVDPSTQTNHYSVPKPMNMDTFNNTSKYSIASFSTVNSVTLPSSSITIDTNNFLMTNNVFNQNFAGMQSDIVELTNIRKINIVSDSYINNWGIFQEALAKYGSITSTGSVTNLSKMPGAWIFAYYGASGSGNTVSDIVSASNAQYYYPISPIVIDGSFFISWYGMVFDNNAMPELTSSTTNFYPSGAFTIRRSQGYLFINSTIVRNYKGHDLTALKTIYGTTNYNKYVKTATPTKRDSSGTPNSLYNYPSFVVDYGYKNSIINLANPSSSSSTDFPNYFDNIIFGGFTINNLTQYIPASDTPMILNIDSASLQMFIDNFTISNVDIILGTGGMFKLKAHMPIYFTNWEINQVNLNAYSLSTTDYQYVGKTGGIFTFRSLNTNENYSFSSYSFTNIIFDTIYGNKGGAFYVEASSDAKSSDYIFITLSNSTFRNSYSYAGGLVWLVSGTQYVYIEESIFTSNTGVKSEADLQIVNTGYLSVYSTEFSNFTSMHRGLYGQSISFLGLFSNLPQTYFNNVTMKWSDTPYDLNYFYRMVSAILKYLFTIFIFEFYWILLNYQIVFLHYICFKILKLKTLYKLSIMLILLKIMIAKSCVGVIEFMRGI